MLAEYCNRHSVSMDVSPGKRESDCRSLSEPTVASSCVRPLVLDQTSMESCYP